MPGCHGQRTMPPETSGIVRATATGSVYVLRSPGVSRARFAMGSPRDLYAQFRSTGVEFAVVRTHRVTARFPSVETIAQADLRGRLLELAVGLEESLIEAVADGSQMTRSQCAANEELV